MKMRRKNTIDNIKEYQFFFFSYFVRVCVRRFVIPFLFSLLLSGCMRVCVCAMDVLIFSGFD